MEAVVVAEEEGPAVVAAGLGAAALVALMWVGEYGLFAAAVAAVEVEVPAALQNSGCLPEFANQAAAG